MTLHPRKIHLQRYAHGVQYLGVVIKPRRSAAAPQTSAPRTSSASRYAAARAPAWA